MFEEVERNLDSNLRPVVQALKSDLEGLWNTEIRLWSRVSGAAATELRQILISAGVVVVCALAGIILGVIGGALFIESIYPGISSGGLMVCAACLLGTAAVFAGISFKKRTNDLLAIGRRSFRLH